MKRRNFLKATGLAGAGLFLPWSFGRMGAFAAIPGGSLDPASIAKYQMPLIIPPAMPPLFRTRNWSRYDIAVRQFQQQILPAPHPATTVWSYGRSFDRLPGGRRPSTYNYPAFTMEVKPNENVFVRWDNHLVDNPQRWRNNYLPHLLPVDPTLHWANPAGPIDMRPMFTSTPGPYTGPVPIVTHVHGAHVGPESDGYPEAWWLPRSSNIPSGYFTKGTRYDSVHRTLPGSAVYRYTNDQRPTTLWYHDHTLGLTRLNVYAGPAGFWIIRDIDEERALNLPGPAPQIYDRPGTDYYEIPIVIQDRSFNTDGSLFYPDTRTFFDGYNGDYVPNTAISPIWNPEFFGNVMVVNGHAWPYLDVEPRRYRFRLLNGCNSRFLVLKFDANLPFWQIGSDGGLLPKPEGQNQLVMAPAERMDVIVDFTNYNGQSIELLNFGPDAPFGGLPVDELADPTSTGKVMQFRVIKPLKGSDTSMNPAGPVVFPGITFPGSETRTRDVTLNEEMLMDGQGNEFPVAALLGTNVDGKRTWMDPITENPQVGDTEIWRVVNLTGDAHPIHLHLVMFQVVDRIPFVPDGAEAYAAAQEEWLEGGSVGDPPVVDDFLDFSGTRDPEPGETGMKDTVIAYPGEITRIKANFDREGLYVWHCHIVEHEDNEMMRPYYVGANPPLLMKDSITKSTGNNVPEDFALYQNYPNPFNPSTTIRFQVPADEYVEIKIYNALGQEVRSLVNGHYGAGMHSVVWNGRDNAGNKLASGLYVYRIQAGRFSRAMKMNLIK